MLKNWLVAGLTLLLIGSFSERTFAHPHVWIEAKTSVVFRAGEIVAIDHKWKFDEIFSAYAIQGLDSDGDGKLSREELQPLAQVNVESLSEFEFFTFMTIAGIDDNVDKQFGEPINYWLDWNGKQLTLNFTLPLTISITAGEKPVEFQVFDPTFFVDFSFDEKNPVQLVNGVEGCNVDVQLPQALAEADRLSLADITADQLELPPELFAITSQRANQIVVKCAS